MARIKLRDLNLPPPPCCPAWCESGAAEIVDHLVKKHNAEPWQIKYVIGFLNESYILSLPRLRYDTHDPESDTSPKRLRWLFYSWTAQILSWTQRRQEGDDDGLSPLVYRVIREVVYPYSKVERPTATPLASSTLFIGHAVHEDPSLSASRGAWSCTDILKQGDIPQQWAQQFPSLIVFKYLTLTSLPKKQESQQRYFERRPKNGKCELSPPDTVEAVTVITSISTWPETATSHCNEVSSSKRVLPPWMLKQELPATLATRNDNSQFSSSARITKQNLKTQSIAQPVLHLHPPFQGLQSPVVTGKVGSFTRCSIRQNA